MDFGCLWLRGLIPEGGLSSVQLTSGVVLELGFHGDISITPMHIVTGTDPLRRSVPVKASLIFLSHMVKATGEESKPRFSVQIFFG